MAAGGTHAAPPRPQAGRTRHTRRRGRRRHTLRKEWRENLLRVAVEDVVDVVVGDVGGEHAADALMFVKPRHIRAVEDLFGTADGDHLLDSTAGAGDGCQFDIDVWIVLREFAGGRPIVVEAVCAHERDMNVTCGYLGTTSRRTAGPS